MKVPASSNVPASILETQRALVLLGYEIDADGRAGSESWGAISHFIATIVAPKPLAATVAPSVPVPTGDRVSDRSERVIATLSPEVQPYARSLIHSAAQQGITIEIVSGTRTYAEQDALYAQGRSKGGAIVTKARGGYSNHNFGIAFDVGVFIGGKYADDLYDQGKIKASELERPYAAVAALGKSLGLEWGGDWKSIVDQPHFQLRPKWAAAMNDPAMFAELRARKAKGTDLYA